MSTWSRVADIKLAVFHTLVRILNIHSSIASVTAAMLSITLSLALLAATGASVLKYDQSSNDGVHWALIVAGSNGWYNYRHQVGDALIICDRRTVMPLNVHF